VIRRLLLISLLCVCNLPALWAQDTYPLLLAGNSQARWNFTLQRGSLSLTGLCIVHQNEDGLVGAVVNEFGMKAFDFTCRNGKLRVANVFPQMNHWYIRRLLRSDLRILAADKQIKLGRKRVLSISLPDSLTLTNLKYNISYHFERLNE